MPTIRNRWMVVLIGSIAALSMSGSSRANAGSPRSVDPITTVFELPRWPELKKICDLNSTQCYGIALDCNKPPNFKEEICFFRATNYRKNTELFHDSLDSKLIAVRDKSSVTFFAAAMDDGEDYEIKQGDYFYARFTATPRKIEIETCVTDLKRLSKKPLNRLKKNPLPIIARQWRLDRHGLCKDSFTHEEVGFVEPISDARPSR